VAFGKKKRRGGRAGGMRLLFATDLHGSEIVFRKFLNAVTVYEADIAIMGGDLTGKRLAPVVQTEDGFRSTVLGRGEVAHTEEELEAMTRRIKDLGQYPVQVSEPEYAHLRQDPAEVDRRFERACQEQVADWMARAGERLEPLGVPLYVTGGNDDYMSIEGVLDDAAYAVNAESKVIEIAPGIEMLSTGYGNVTPWRCPRDIPEEDLWNLIATMAGEVRDPPGAIFNLHVPPYGSGLDVAPRLDTSIDPPRPFVGEDAPVGSTAVRRAILEFRPVLSLHGHIHESPGIRQIGVTTSINPGSEYGEGVLRSAVVDLDGPGRIRGAQLLSA
jgi:Icc-related predicted phosphoesterase